MLVTSCLDNTVRQTYRHQLPWDLWWIEWQCDRFFSQYFGLPLSLPFHHCSTIPSSLHKVLSAVLNQSVEEGQTSFFVCLSVRSFVCYLVTQFLQQRTAEKFSRSNGNYQPITSFNGILSYCLEVPCSKLVPDRRLTDNSYMRVTTS